MAELPDLGARCGFESCRRLDFLPFTCPLCKLCYCTDHRFTHGCSDSKQYDPDTAAPSLSVPVKNFLCSYSECNGAESIKIVCPYCERNYCLKHRHADEHSCENLPENTAPKPRQLPPIPAPEPPSLPAEKPAPKARATAPLSEAERKKLDKILLMKLKMNAKATADVSPEERMFLFVEGDDLSQRKAVVVSKKWTVGRCASNIARLLGLDTSKVKCTDNDIFRVRPPLSFVKADETAIVKVLQIFPAGSEEPLDYADSVSSRLNDMDTIVVQLV